MEGFIAPHIRRSAVEAGIGEDELAALAALIGRGQGDLREPERHRRAATAGQREGPEEIDADIGTVTPPADLPADPLAASVVQLTKILATMTAPKSGPGNLDQALDSLMSGPSAGSAGDGIGGGGTLRSGAAARLFAERALVERPSAIYGPIERSMAVALPAGSRRLDGSAAARVWLETRSLLSEHRPTINVAWLVGGIHEALSVPEPKVEEARARAALLLSCLEQCSLDKGSWQIAWEAALEPYSAFGQRRPSTSAGSGEAMNSAFSPIMDPRLRELHLARLRYADETLEKRRKLQDRRPFVPRGLQEPSEPKAGGKAPPFARQPRNRGAKGEAKGEGGGGGATAEGDR